MANIVPDDVRLAAVQRSYNSRATTYNALVWHDALAADCVAWARIPRGGRVLDLAAGTGLVTLRAARAVGPAGRVVAVDIADQFMAVGQAAAAEQQLDGTIEWHLGDVGNLGGLGLAPASFDAVVCCSALVLLPDIPAALRHWARYVKPGGTIVADVISEDASTEYWGVLHALEAQGLPMTHSRGWITGVESVERVLETAGLKGRVWKTDAYTAYQVDMKKPEVYWDKMLANELTKEARESDPEKLEAAKRAFFEMAKELAAKSEDGMSEEHVSLYIIQVEV